MLAMVAAFLFLLPTSAPAEISALFTIDAKPVLDIVKERLADEGAQWVVVNRRNGKLLVDMTIPNRATAVALKDYLTENDYNPRLLGLWKFSGLHEGEDYSGPADGEGDRPIVGTPVRPFRRQEYIDMMPDDCTYTYDGDGNVLTEDCVRPTTPRQLHAFFGWKPRRR
jgi:hypothetical protein